MLLWMLKRKGQSITEYAIVCAALIAGVMAMQGYVRRAMEGRIKTEVDAFAGGAAGHEQMISTYSVSGTSNKTIDAGSQSFTSTDSNIRSGDETY